MSESKNGGKQRRRKRGGAGGHAPQSPGGGEVHEMKEQAAGRAEDGGRICMVSEGGAG